MSYVIFFNFFHWTGITFDIPAFVCVIIAGILVGLGHYLCLSQDSSTVGYDVIALYLHKLHPKWNPAIILRIIGMIVLVVGIATFGIWSVIYGILSVSYTHLDVYKRQHLPLLYEYNLIKNRTAYHLFQLHGMEYKLVIVSCFLIHWD